MTIKLLTIETNMSNYWKLLQRGFEVSLNDACTRLIVTLHQKEDEVLRQVSDALSLQPDELDIQGFTFEGLWMVQPAEVPFVEVEK